MRTFIKILVVFFSILLMLYGILVLLKNIQYNIENYNATAAEKYNITLEIVIPSLITFFGTFLGFILAIFGELKINKIINNKETKEIVNALAEEISINLSKQYDVDELYHEFYQLYTFEGIYNSGKLCMIIDKLWYPELIELYNKYREVNFYFLLSIQQLQMQKDDTKIIENQKKTIEDLSQKAKVLLEKIKQ